jgi:hypothetical protein
MGIAFRQKLSIMFIEPELKKAVGSNFVGWVEALRNPTPISRQPIVVFYLIHVPKHYTDIMSPIKINMIS